MPEALSDIDYTVDVGRHETMFRQDARAAGLTVKSFF
jgi:hypothetical protein